MSRIIARRLLAVVLVGLMVGCSSSEQETVAHKTPASSTGAKVEPTRTEEPEEVSAIDRSDPGLGVTFTELPDVTSETVDAVDALTLYEVELWRAYVALDFSSELDALVSEDVAAALTSIIDQFAENGVSISGEEVFAVTDAVLGEDPVLGTPTVDVGVCEDASAIMYSVNGDDPKTAAERGAAPEAFAQKYTYTMVSPSSADGSWYLSQASAPVSC